MITDAKRVLNNIIYLSGFRGISGPILGSIKLFDEKLSFVSSKEEDVFDLLFSEIIDSFYQSTVEEVIGKPVAFGLISAYHKKTVYHLVILSMQEDGSDGEIVFEIGTEKDKKFLEMIVSRINQ